MAAHSSILAWEIPCSIPGLGRSPGEGSGDPLQCSCLESSTDRGAWRATVHGAAESDTTEHSTAAANPSQGSFPVNPPSAVPLPPG